MRRSNWKSKLVILVAFVIGVFGGFVVHNLIPEAYAAWRGLATWGTVIVISALLVFLMVRVFHIGDDY